MCKSKLHGGMGFRNLQAFNLAMLAKQAWRLLTRPDSLISRIYKARYFPHSDVLNAHMGCNPSYAWHSIHSSLIVICRGKRWWVGNGKTIHIWRTNGSQRPRHTKQSAHPAILMTFLWSPPSLTMT